MNVLLTGATGFIGKHLTIRLCELGHNVKCFVRDNSVIKDLENFKNISFIKGDLKEDFHGICKDIDIVIHLAAQLGEWGIKDKDYYDLNVKTTERLLEECHTANVKQFIFCSTPGVLGLGKRLGKETDEYNPCKIYEKTKVTAELKTIEYCTVKNINYTILRPDFVYGIGDIRRIKLYRNIKNKKFLLFNQGTSYLHPTYIDDVVDGFVLVMDNPKAYNSVFNIAGPRDVSVEEFLKLIAKYTDSKLMKLPLPYFVSIGTAKVFEFLFEKMLHREPPISRGKIDFLSLDHSSDITKAREILNYNPKMEVEEGIKKTVSWYIKNNLL